MADVLSIKEYAALKGVHRETVIRWIREGYVKAERTGPRGHYRITSDDVGISRILCDSQPMETRAH